MNVLRKPFRYSYHNTVFVLIGLNILVFLATSFLKGMNLTVYLSMIPLMVRQGWVWQLATYMFVHASISHLVFNMLALFVFGVQVERRMGSAEFLLYYLSTGVMAGLFSFIVYWFTGSWTIFLMGASGALFAVQLAYASFFPNSVIYIWGILPLKAPVMVLVFTGIEIFSMISGFQGNVAHFTHLAGAGFGWLYFVVRYGVSPWRAMRG